MPKALCYVGLVVSVLLLLVFGLDLAISYPFGGVSLTMDVGFVLGGAALAYLSWATLREQV